ncbi:DEAD-box ATP-dependent RNA helicase 20 [Vigna radiata var. radiata]|uniref:RNA helicase n=1 Tax=Vigna radiata var. radiata TaxID=3916 RepID=A0A1S3VKQ5_VIGRR|nr:DEAD-box ATP-dependent RNA helicase 20 [Vigna radiata var. radiata]
MSYVPPHLRNNGSATVATARTPSVTLDNNNHHHHNLNNHHKLAFTSNNNNTTNANGSPSLPSFHNASRWSSAAPPSPRIFATPDPVFPQWQPSERASRMTPEQIEEVRSRLNLDVTVASDSPPAPAPIESFTDMCLHSSIMKDIAYHEYTRPTSIQAQAMPIALSGRDLLGCAETGSGKTAAFTIPMIQHCLAQPSIRRNDGPLALVLAPTRELAQQIEKEVKAFSRSLESLKTAIVVGGTNIEKQRAELRAGIEIAVATPGRFIDHLQQGNTSLSRISFVVLDEADRMLDMGFEPQIREVMRSLPEKHQTLLFSATMPVEIEALAKEYLASSVQVKVGKVSSPTTNVSQTLVKISENEKIDRLLDLLVEDASQAEKCGHPFPLTIVFVERKTRCDEVAEALVAQGLSAVSLHGGRSQSEREAALHDFRSGSTNILVATDVASRGLDVTGVSHVINLDLPKTMEDYVHRIGRTGRAGSTGLATSFYTDRDMFLVANIRKAIADAESGNTLTFATGKVARRKEKEAAAAQKEANIALSKQLGLGAASINIEDKYKFMITAANIKREGAADSAWDD